MKLVYLNCIISSGLLKEVAEFILKPKGRCEAWRKSTLLLALNLGYNHEGGSYKVLAERELEWQAMNSLCLISFALCKRGIFMCLEKYALKNWFPHLLILPSGTGTSYLILFGQKGDYTKDAFPNKMWRYYVHRSTCASSATSCCK